MSLPLLRKGLRLPSLAARPVRRISSNPPQNPVGPLESIIALTVMFTACMGPAGYILVNLESYKKRE